jgi:hypothetical protein
MYCSVGHVSGVKIHGPVLIITRLLSLPNATKIGLLTLESFFQCLFRPASYSYMNGDYSLENLQS